MTRRSIRLLASVALTALLLVGSPWSRGGSAQAAAGPTASQSLTMTVPSTGVLTVSATASTVSWNYGSTADLGQLNFTNTLNDGFTWNITAAMTDLLPTSGTFSGTCSTSSTNCLTFTAVTWNASSVFGGIAGASTTGLAKGSSGAFTGTDITAGTTLSNAKFALTGTNNNKGSYTQGDTSVAGDNNLTTSGGPVLEAGTYTGTLQYTITG